MKGFISNKFDQRSRILVKLSFRGFCHLKLSGLRACDNIIISFSQKTGKDRRGRL